MLRKIPKGRRSQGKADLRKVFESKNERFILNVVVRGGNCTGKCRHLKILGLWNFYCLKYSFLIIFRSVFAGNITEKTIVVRSKTVFYNFCLKKIWLFPRHALAVKWWKPGSYFCGVFVKIFCCDTWTACLEQRTVNMNKNYTPSKYYTIFIVVKTGGNIKFSVKAKTKTSENISVYKMSM